MNKEISIITPVYNVPIDYIKECAQSVFASTYSKWEWIIVDDGSTDPEVQAFLSTLKDNRIKILRSAHRGVSYARNLALSNVHTEYFLFLDADDVIAPSFIERGITLSRQYNADIVVGRTIEFFTSYSFSDTNQTFFVASLDRAEETSKIKQYIQSGVPPKGLPFDGYKWFPTMIASKITRTSLLNDLQFDEKLTIAEDYLFFTSLFMKSNRTIFSEEIWYGYRQHCASTMAHSSLSAIVNQMDSWSIVYQKSNRLGWDKESLGLRYLSAIINRVTYHPHHLSLSEVHSYLQQVENCKFFEMAQHCRLSTWELSTKRKILISLIQHKWNWTAALILSLGSLNYLRKNSLKRG